MARKPKKLGNKLETWDFSDEALNSKSSLINRQKSAYNLSPSNVDRDAGIAEFGRTTLSDRCSLHDCTCTDFNFICGNRRKKYQPCMHIYRLAHELGLFTLKHKDYAAKMAELTDEERKALRVAQIRKTAYDTQGWGGWSAKCHSCQEQKGRQLRGWDIYDEGEFNLPTDFNGAMVRDYHTGLDFCSCPDFSERKLPCKHIYCLAIALGLPIAATEEDRRDLMEGLKAGFVIFSIPK